jgi:hypothetical protein
MFNTDIPLKVIILSVILELSLPVRRTTDATNQQTTKWLVYYKCFKSFTITLTNLFVGVITSFCNNGEIIAVIQNDYYYFVSRLFEQFKISPIYDGTQYYEYVVHFHNINTCKGYQGFLWGIIQARDIIKRQWQEIHEEIGQHGLNSYFHA